MMSENNDGNLLLDSRLFIGIFGIVCLAVSISYLMLVPTEFSRTTQFVLSAIFLGMHLALLITILRKIHWDTRKTTIAYLLDVFLIALTTWFFLWSGVLQQNLQTSEDFFNFNFLHPLTLLLFVVLVWVLTTLKINLGCQSVVKWTIAILVASLFIGNALVVLDLLDFVNFPSKTSSASFVMSAVLIVLLSSVSALPKYRKKLLSSIALHQKANAYKQLKLLTAIIVPAVIIYLIATRDQQTGSFGVQVSSFSLIILLSALTIRLFFATRSFASLQRDLMSASQIDELTKLANRSLILEKLAVAIDVSAATGCTPTICVIDIDRFKNINESHGHSIGDELLIAIAQRIKTSMSDGVLVGRLFRDEFVILDTKTKTAIESVVLADRILALLLAPFKLSHGDVLVSASIGVATYRPDQTRSSADLLSNADTAKYWAKDAGRNCVAVFDESMHQRAKQRLATETALYRALERRELRLVHQPIIDIDLGDVTGFEALMRWTTQDGTVIPPSEFIPIAEETGIIVPIGGWALLEALIHLRNWINEGICARDATMSVNVSSRQLHDPNFVAVVNEALMRSSMPADQLWLEVTESMMITQPEQALKTLRELSSLGVRIAIDDFGTGYSSLSFLQRFPIHRLKIDKSFVNSLATDNSARTLVKTIIVMAESLGLDVVAEGVETVQQLHALGDLQCSQAQGYLISHPVEPHDMGTTLETLSKIGKWPRLRPVN